MSEKRESLLSDRGDVTDVVERLRHWADWPEYPGTNQDLRDAATEIETLRASLSQAGAGGGVVVKPLGWNDSDRGCAAELLPCPFCGGKADWHNIGNEHTKSRSTKIWCSECRVTRNTGAIRHSLDWTKEHAFAAWNRRHTPSSPVSAPSPAGGVREAAVAAVERLANVQMNISLAEWSKLSAAILAALSSPATPEPVLADNIARRGAAGNGEAVEAANALDLVRLGARAMRRMAQASCGNHSEGALEDAMTSGGLSKEDKTKLYAEADAADHIRKDIAETVEDSALGYASYMGDDEDRKALAALGVNSDWLCRRANGEPSRPEIAALSNPAPGHGEGGL